MTVRKFFRQQLGNGIETLEKKKSIVFANYDIRGMLIWKNKALGYAQSSKGMQGVCR